MASLTDPLKGQPETRISEGWVYYRPSIEGEQPRGFKAGDEVDLKNRDGSWKRLNFTPSWNKALSYRYRSPLPVSDLPDGNPKTAAGALKTPLLSVIPPTVLIQVGEVMRLGREKYGAYNWRDQPVSYSTYVDAAMRHLASFWDGETVDPESGESHLANAIAGLSVLLDAIATGNATDDRPPAGPTADIIRARAKLREERRAA